MRTRSVPMLLALAAAAACSSEPAAIQACEAADGVTPVCGFTNPEDLALAPGGAWLLVSQYPPAEEAAGSLVAWRISDGTQQHLFPAPADARVPAGAPVAAGSPECPGPPDPARFAPHGIDVAAPPRTPPQLLVVNHGGREAVEIFEIGFARGAPALWWRGCVPLPAEAWPNDVAALPAAAGGGFVVTKMMPPMRGAGGVLTGLRMALGMQTGLVYEWQPDTGWRELAGTAGSAPNGVAVSPDGGDVFVAEWAAERLVRVRRGGDPDRRELALPHRPDNLTWTPDGRLLVAGQKGGLGDVLGCAGLESGACAVPYSVLSVDPVTLETATVLDRPARATGAVSVALAVGGELWLGSFAADRIARAPFHAGAGATR